MDLHHYHFGICITVYVKKESTCILIDAFDQKVNLCFWCQTRETARFILSNIILEVSKSNLIKLVNG